MTLRGCPSVFPFRFLSPIHRRLRRIINIKTVVSASRVIEQRVCMHDMQIFVGRVVYRGSWALGSLSLSPSLKPWTRGSGLNHRAPQPAFYNPGHQIRSMYVSSPPCVMLLFLMVVRKGHNVVVPWPGHDLFYSQPQPQGEFHYRDAALSLF